MMRVYVAVPELLYEAVEAYRQREGGLEWSQALVKIASEALAVDVVLPEPDRRLKKQRAYEAGQEWGRKAKGNEAITIPDSPRISVDMEQAYLDWCKQVGIKPRGSLLPDGFYRGIWAGWSED